MEGENGKTKDIDNIGLTEPLLESLHIIKELTDAKKEFKKSIVILTGLLMICITITISVFIVAVSFAPTDIRVTNESHSESVISDVTSERGEMNE